MHHKITFKYVKEASPYVVKTCEIIMAETEHLINIVKPNFVPIVGY